MPEEDKEMTAMSAVFAALADLDDEARARVLDYVTRRLRIVGVVTNPQRHQSDVLPAAIMAPSVEAPVSSGLPVDIKALKDEKQPASSIQMAVLVAYYLKALAPRDERKEAVSASDMETYFTQARYPLPTGKNGMTDTLNNARRGGYFESAGTGLFRLNSVGFNLAAYNMPTETKRVSAKPRKKPAKKQKR